jgi:hypothetical protein
MSQIQLPSMQTRFLASQMNKRSIEREMARRKRLALEHARQSMERSNRRETNRKNRERSLMNADDIFRDNMLKLVEADRADREAAQTEETALDRLLASRQIGAKNRAFVEELSVKLQVFDTDSLLMPRREKLKNILNIFSFMNRGRCLEDFICDKLRMPAHSETENSFSLILVIYLKIRELESCLTHNDGELEIPLGWEMDATKKMIDPMIRGVMDEASFKCDKNLKMYRTVISMI